MYLCDYMNGFEVSHHIWIGPQLCKYYDFPNQIEMAEMLTTIDLGVLHYLKGYYHQKF